MVAIIIPKIHVYYMLLFAVYAIRIINPVLSHFIISTECLQKHYSPD